MWWPGTELNRRRQPFQNSDFQCFQQLQRLPWDCQTLENTGNTNGSWVIAVGDFIVYVDVRTVSGIVSAVVELLACRTEAAVAFGKISKTLGTVERTVLAESTIPRAYIRCDALLH